MILDMKLIFFCYLHFIIIEMNHTWRLALLMCDRKDEENEIQIILTSVDLEKYA